LFEFCHDILLLLRFLLLSISQFLLLLKLLSVSAAPFPVIPFMALEPTDNLILTELGLGVARGTFTSKDPTLYQIFFHLRLIAHLLGLNKIDQEKED